ncbi:MAG: hypothetical protein IKJ28_03865, partial [Alphaproteobacteria bacterium]|nr:hypothetical protein [Alphaproteobacteria bacterium]
KLIQINLVSQTDGVPYEWEEFEEDLPSPYTYFIRRDKAHNDFVLVEAVEQKICVHLNRLAQDAGELTLYTMDNTPMDCSAETQEVVVSFNGAEQLIPCANNNECPNQEGIYCDADEEICQACGFDERLNDDENGCIDLCADRADEKITSCKIETEEIGWCCRYDEFCSETKAGECIPSDGSCIYTFFDTDTDMGYKTDCSYYVGISEVMEKSETDCSYSVGTGGKIEPVNDCIKPNQYCVLNWTKPSWKKGDPLPTAKASSTGILYGKCQSLTTNDINPIITFSEGAGLVYPKMDCGSSTQYCVLNWIKSSWEKGETVPTAKASSTGVLYGKCQALTIFNNQPYYEQTENSNKIFNVEKECPPKMYCHLQWKNISCSTAGASTTGRIYGACALWDERNTMCPKPAE